ncbi:MAG: fibronectin type III domain-containing protein, partial [Deltaproteobacteria bacterium]|nr:fibronectin type III domain-containing protein [Deltaproteobacteria bacterium]
KLNGADGSDFMGSGEPAPTPTVENVVWTSIVNATATGNSLQKTSGCNGCDDAGAISLQKITSGGYVEFTVSETGTLRYVGLSNGSFSTGATEIDFAIAIGWGWAEVRENGAFRANTTAVAGDLFRILAEAGMVKYYKNGALVYLSAVAPAYPLVLDTSLFNVGAAVNNAVIAGTLDSGGGSGSDTTAPVISNVASSSVSSNGATITWTTNEPSDSQVEYGTTTAYGNSTPLDPSLVTSHTQTLSALASNTVYHYRVRSSDAAGNLAVSGDFTFATTGSGTGTTVENVIWTDIVNATATGNSLTKTYGCDGCDDAGAVSQQQITGDGYVEFTVTETDLLRYVGLSNGSSGTGYSEIDYAFAVGFGWVEVRENGIYRANAGIAAGDVLRIAVESGVVNYYINGSLLYRSAVAPLLPLVVDSSLFSLNATVSNALIAY